MPKLVDVKHWDGEGYRPLIYSGGWMVAILNWEPLFDIQNAREIERHQQTDEVFVLLRGKAALLVSDGEQFELLDMQPEQIYNVRSGVWHALVTNRDASFLIVENRDTDLVDTEIRPMAESERTYLLSSLPGWAAISAG